MEEKVENAMKFYLLATKLKYKIRSGWDKNHWNIKSDRVESIAEHVYGTCILAISLNSQFELNLDMEKVLLMLTIHEIGEVVIGDITPFDKITIEEKHEIEHKAMLEVLGDLLNKEELFNLLLEFDRHDTKESKFAYMCDKIEADIQSKIYQDKGCHHDLNDQENNIIMNDEKITNIIDNGAKNVFDIWYEYDKSKYIDDPIFMEIMDYIKNNNIDI